MPAGRTSRADLKHRWEADGSAEDAIRNIVCHIDVLLSDDQKAAINWHDRQNAALAVMRIIGWLSGK